MIKSYNTILIAPLLLTLLLECNRNGAGGENTMASLLELSKPNHTRLYNVSEIPQECLKYTTTSVMNEDDNGILHIWHDAFVNSSSLKIKMSLALYTPTENNQMHYTRYNCDIDGKQLKYTRLQNVDLINSIMKKIEQFSVYKLPPSIHHNTQPTYTPRQLPPPPPPPPQSNREAYNPANRQHFAAFTPSPPHSRAADAINRLNNSIYRINTVDNKSVGVDLSHLSYLQYNVTLDTRYRHKRHTNPKNAVFSADGLQLLSFISDSIDDTYWNMQENPNPDATDSFVSYMTTRIMELSLIFPKLTTAQQTFVQNLLVNIMKDQDWFHALDYSEPAPYHNSIQLTIDNTNRVLTLDQWGSLNLLFKFILDELMASKTKVHQRMITLTYPIVSIVIKHKRNVQINDCILLRLPREMYTCFLANIHYYEQSSDYTKLTGVIADFSAQLHFSETEEYLYRSINRAYEQFIQATIASSSTQYMSRLIEASETLYTLDTLVLDHFLK